MLLLLEERSRLIVFRESTMTNGRKYNGKCTKHLFPLQGRHRQSVIAEPGCGFAIFLNITPGSHHKSELSDKMKSMWCSWHKKRSFSSSENKQETTPLQEHKCPSQHWTEECADLAEGTQNCLFMLAQQKTSGSHSFKADFPNKSIN